MAHGLAVAAIGREGDTDFLRIVAGDLKTVGAPAQVRYRHSDRPIVPPLAASGMPMKKQTVDVLIGGAAGLYGRLIKLSGDIVPSRHSAEMADAFTS
jgi:hypothetical protein